MRDGVKIIAAADALGSAKLNDAVRICGVWLRLASGEIKATKKGAAEFKRE